MSSAPRITINGVPLPYEHEVRNLGVKITSTLSWKPHVRQILRKVHSTLSMLRFHRRSLSRSLRKDLVESLVFPLFDYACVVYRDLDGERTLALQRAQNACVRFVHGCIPHRAHVSPFRLALGWLSAASRRDYFLGSLAYSVLSHQCPQYLARGFTRLDTRPEIRHSARLPQRTLLYAAPRTEAWQQSFCIQASIFLNSLETEVFDPTAVGEFRRSLREQLLGRDAGDWARRVLLEGIDPDLQAPVADPQPP